MRAVVTGGAGFIGSHLVDALLARGDEVVRRRQPRLGQARERRPGARRSTSATSAPSCERSRSAARRRLPPRRAGRRRTSVRRPDYDADGQRGRHRAACSRRRARAGAQVVFSSTGGAIYGECDAPGARGRRRGAALAVRDREARGEEYLAGWNRLHGTRHVVAAVRERLRPAPGRRARGRRRRDLPRADGARRAGRRSSATASRPATSSTSATSCAALLAAAGRDGGVFNVGTGVETSVSTCTARAPRRGRRPEPRARRAARAGRRAPQRARRLAARRELGWRAEVALEDGLRLTLEG